MWDSHRDTKGLRMWAPHKQDSKIVSLWNTNIGPYFQPQQLPTPPPPLLMQRAPHQRCLFPQPVICGLWFDQLCCPTEEIINNSLNSSPLTSHCDSAEHCMFTIMIEMAMWQPVYSSSLQLSIRVQSEFKDPNWVTLSLQTHFTTVSRESKLTSVERQQR